MAASQRIRIEGYVSAGFDAVREAFAENFLRRHELGGACCAYHRGEKVVDLWGGVRDKSTGEPWEVDTMVVVYSATKGLAAMTLAVAHSRGWLDYEYIRLPESIPNSRLATLAKPSWRSMLCGTGFPIRLMLASFNRKPASATHTSPARWGQRSEETLGTSRYETRCTPSFQRHHRP